MKRTIHCLPEHLAYCIYRHFSCETRTTDKDLLCSVFLSSPPEKMSKKTTTVIAYSVWTICTAVEKWIDPRFSKEVAKQHDSYDVILTCRHLEHFIYLSPFPVKDVSLIQNFSPVSVRFICQTKIFMFLQLNK